MQRPVRELSQLKGREFLHERLQFTFTEGRQLDRPQTGNSLELNARMKVAFCKRAGRKSNASHQKSPYFLVSLPSCGSSKKSSSIACPNRPLILRVSTKMASANAFSNETFFSRCCRLSGSSTRRCRHSGTSSAVLNHHDAIMIIFLDASSSIASPIVPSVKCGLIRLTRRDISALSGFGSLRCISRSAKTIVEMSSRRDAEAVPNSVSTHSMSAAYFVSSAPTLAKDARDPFRWLCTGNRSRMCSSPLRTSSPSA